LNNKATSDFRLSSLEPAAAGRDDNGGVLAKVKATGHRRVNGSLIRALQCSS